MTTRPLNEYGERMARLENKVDNVETNICTIDNKLDLVLETKADKREVDKLNNKFWGLAVGTIFILISIVGYLLRASNGMCL